MADNELNIGVHGEDSIEGVIRRLGIVQQELPFQIRKSLEDVASDLVAEARERALAQPAFGTEHTGLRGKVAAGVRTVKIPNGIRIITAMPEEDEAIIPRGLDRVKGWRHPVFGNKNKWVTQHGEFSWFMDTMQHGQQPLEDKIQEAIDDAVELVDNGF